jgi:hypothetical protein
MATQTQSGKAFEYALITAAENLLSASVTVTVLHDAAYNTAFACYNLFNGTQKGAYSRAALAAITQLVNLEPRLIHPAGNNDILELKIMPDTAGVRGDVRDVLFIRSLQSNWEIGISAKNNHRALKHSRLSDVADFGQTWLGLGCSANYFATILPVFAKLRTLQSAGTAWNTLPNKHRGYYMPVLDAFRDEMNLLDANHANVPALLVSYLLGRNDFYKVMKRTGVVEIMGFNMNGTLNKSIQPFRPIIRVPQLQLPTQIIQLDYKPGSTDTLLLVCNHGWSISFRIHNAETRVVPSLKFDINLVGQPHNIYSTHIPY